MYDARRMLTVDVRVLDVAVNIALVEELQIGQVLAQTADLPCKPIALGSVVTHVAHGRVDDILR